MRWVTAEDVASIKADRRDELAQHPDGRVGRWTTPTYYGGLRWALEALLDKDARLSKSKDLVELRDAVIGIGEIVADAVADMEKRLKEPPNEPPQKKGKS